MTTLLIQCKLKMITKPLSAGGEKLKSFHCMCATKIAMSLICVPLRLPLNLHFGTYGSLCSEGSAYMNVPVSSISSLISNLAADSESHTRAADRNK